MSFVPTLQNQIAAKLRSIKYARPKAIKARILRAAVALGVLMGLSPLTAWADEQAAASDSHWGLGLSVGSIDKPYTDIDSETVVVPIVFYENRWFSIAGPVADLKLPSDSPVSFRLRARYELGSGYEAEDSTALASMEERKGSVWIGGAAIWKSDIVDVSAEWLGDASNNSEGQRATLGLHRRFSFGSVSLTPRIEGIWLDQDYVAYYYGVLELEALVDRPVYEGDSTINTRIGLRLDYRPQANHAWFLDVAATRLGAEIEDSPIVDGSNSSSVFLGYTYIF